MVRPRKFPRKGERKVRSIRLDDDDKDFLVREFGSLQMAIDIAVMRFAFMPRKELKEMILIYNNLRGENEND